MRRLSGFRKGSMEGERLEEAGRTERNEKASSPGKFKKTIKRTGEFQLFSGSLDNP